MFFFFRQKTAYEMRISDWSSDVCSSDLRVIGLDSLARPWLGDYAAALPSVGLVGTWVGTGLCLILMLAGMAKIPRELYEAARPGGCRTEERRVGKACVGTCRSRWSPCHYKNKQVE